MSNAELSEYNGTYNYTGVTRFDGKAFYVLSTNSNYGMAYLYGRWMIGFIMYFDEGGGVYMVDMMMGDYENMDTGDTPPSAGWEQWGDPSSISVQMQGKALMFSLTEFLEHEKNDGSIENTIIITYNEYDGDALTGAIGTDYFATNRATVTNVPPGLVPQLVKNSNNSVSFSLVGKAYLHENANDISNLNIEFHNSAFTDEDASDVVNSTRQLSVNFRQVHTVGSTGDYSLIHLAVNSLSVKDHDILELAAETFTTSVIVEKTLIIRGKGAGKTIIQAHALENEATGRVLNIFQGKYCKIYDVTIRNGKTGSQQGGGILSWIPLYLYNCIIENNILTTAGSWGAGVYAGKDLYVYNCIFDNNKCTTPSASNSSAIETGGNMYIYNSIFMNNIGTLSVLSFNSDIARVVNCTFVDNTSNNIIAKMSGLNANATIINSIIYNNTLTNIFTDYHNQGTQCHVYNSILQTTNGINGTNSNNLTSDPLLQVLANNHGVMQSIAIVAGSPAIDAGITGADIPETDIRGYYANGTRDIGAFEYNGNGCTWMGETSSDWNEASNWWGNRVPTDEDFVYIPLEMAYPIISESPASPAECRSIRIDAPASLTVAAGKALTVTDDITNYGSLILQSDATGTATLVNSGANYNFGVQKAQLYATGSNDGLNITGRYWYVSTPVSGDYFSVYGEVDDSKIWVYQEESATYRSPFNNPERTWEKMVSDSGHVVRFANNTTIEYSGTFNTDDILYTLTRTGTEHAKRGFHLVGNPYASYVNWDDVVKTNVLPTMWYRTENTVNEMVFDTYNAISKIGTNNNGRGTVNAYIPPMQAFWVRVEGDGNTGTLGFTNAMRSHQSNNLLKDEVQQDVIRLQIAQGDKSDELILVFNPNAQDGLDAFDSEKMFANIVSLPQLYSIVENKELVINGMQSVEMNQILPLGVEIGAAGTYTIAATHIEGLFGVPVVLEDKLYGIFHDLQSGAYSFTTDATATAERFVLHLKSEEQATDIDNVPTETITVHSQSKHAVVTTSETAGEITITDVLGRTVVQKNITATTTRISLEPGVYVVTVTTKTMQYVQRVVIF